MKKKLIFAFCVFLFLGILGAAGYYVWAKKNRKVDPCRAGYFTILCMGDSITARGYPSVLQKLLAKEGFDKVCVRNLGRSGNTSGEFLNFLSTHPDVLKGRVDVVLIQLGTNDIRIDHDHTDTQTFAANMEKIVGLIRSRRPKARIFIATIPPVLKDVPGYFDGASRARVAREINPLIARLARKIGCTRVDIYRAFEGHQEWYDKDGIHPNAVGTRKLAEVYLQAVLPVLSKTFGVIHYSLPAGFHDRLVFQSDVDGDTEIYLLTRKGLRKLTDNTIPDEYPVFSPDGKKVLYMTKPGKRWLLALLTLSTGESRIVVDLKEKNAWWPAWCPDGRRVVFDTDTWGKSELAVYDLRSKEMTRLTDTIGKNSLPDCFPDGKTIVFTGNRGLGWHIYKLDMATRKMMKLTHKRGNCRPHVSPDGKWIAFVSESHGKSDIFLMRPDGTEIHSLTKDPGHWEYYPAWSRDGKRVYFSKSVKHWGAPWHLWGINADGTNAFQITRGFSQDRYVDAD